MILDKFTICFGSLDLGYLDDRLFRVLEGISADNNLRSANILVLAQRYSDKSINSINEFKRKLKNLNVVFNNESGFIKSFPMVRTETSKLASTDYVYVVDDDTHFLGDTSEFLAKMESGVDILENSRLIKIVHIRAGKSNYFIRFPHRLYTSQNLFRRSEISKGIFDEWINIRNLEDITLYPMLLDKGYLTVIAGVSKFKHPFLSTKETSTVSKSAFGVPIMKRMHEYYIVMANFDEKVAKYKSLLSELSHTEKSLIEQHNIELDFDSTSIIDPGAWSPKQKYIDRYFDLRDNPNWKLLMLDEFYKSLGLSGIPFPSMISGASNV